MPRTPEVQKAYQEALKHIDGCPLCWRAKQKNQYAVFVGFEVIVCDYPYSIYEGKKVIKHLMIVAPQCQPSRTVKNKMMKAAEFLKPNSIIINFNKHASVPDHYHIHLIWTE
jgi:hypothetical protein